MLPSNTLAAPRMSPLEQDMEYERDDSLDHDENDQVSSDIRPQESFSSSASTSSTTSNNVPTNESLLGTAFLSFLTFALLEIVFASIAGSDAMMADGASMIVDSMTYLCNYYAERRKKQLNDDDIHADAQIGRGSIQWDRIKRKKVLQLEIISPLLSVSTLLVITVLVLHRAISILLLDLHRSRSEQAIPNVNLMMGFSFFNLVLDCFNMYCFAKSRHLLGFATVEDSDWDAAPAIKSAITSGRKSSYAIVHMGDDDDSGHGIADNDNVAPKSLVATDRLMHVHSSHHHHHHADNQHANLNMCSAYTHVFADTLRSIAVLIAAGLAILVPGVSSEEADATAAVFVSILIVLSLVPLFQGLWRSFAELRAIADLEKHDADMRPPGGGIPTTAESRDRNSLP